MNAATTLRAVASAVTLASSLLAAPAAAENPPACDWKFEFYGLGEGTASCTCGPPGDVLLAEALGELTEELGVERPKYRGSIIQAAGSASGTWTYTPGSNVCMAAIHAGLIPSLAEGGIVDFAASAGCPQYEGSEQNDIFTYDGAAAGRSFFFPALTRGACPGEKGYASRYDGPPASEVIPQLIELSLPSGGARIAKVESLGHEALAIDGLTLVPEPGKSQPIRFGRIVVERVDLEHLLARLPPRYLTLRATDISLPTKDLPPVLAAVFGGQRVKAALSLDWTYNPAKRELALRGAVLSIEGFGTLRLRARLDAIPPYAGLFEAPESVTPRWIRLWVEDQTLLRGLLGTEAGETLAGLAALQPGSGPRQQAVLAGLAQLLAEGAGEVQAFLRPVEAQSFAALSERLEADPMTLIEETRFAFVHGGGAPPALAEAAAGLTPVQPFWTAEENVRVAFAGAGGDAANWIALHYAGEPPDSTVTGYRELAGSDRGEADFGRLASGLYEAVLWLRRPDGTRQASAFAWFAVR